jgi:hypothetical protein
MNAGRRREDVGDDSAVRKLARRRKGGTGKPLQRCKAEYRTAKRDKMQGG